MVVGGYGGRVLSDVWLLDVIDGSWGEVRHVCARVHGVYMYTKKELSQLSYLGRVPPK